MGGLMGINDGAGGGQSLTAGWGSGNGTPISSISGSDRGPSATISVNPAEGDETWWRG